MKKNLRFMLVSFFAMLASGVFADNVIDELTWEGLGLNATSISYADFSDKSFTSAAVYAGQASSGTGKYIQLRTKNNNAGIISTTSGGKLKSVTVSFNESTTDRAVSIYAKNTPYGDASDLYDESKAGTKLGDIAADDESFKLTVNGDYAYIGIRSKDGAIYIDKISIEWDASGDIPAPPVILDPVIKPNGGSFFESIEVTMTCATEGATIYYTEESDKLEFEWIAYNGPITLTKTTMLWVKAVKDNVETEPFYVTFTKQEPISVAEALRVIDALEDGTTTNEVYQVKGYIVGTPEFERNKEGNLYGNVNLQLADQVAGSIPLTVYRGKDYNNQNFTEETLNRFKEGDQVVFQGNLQKFVKDGVTTPEIKNCYLISVNGGEAPAFVAAPVISPNGKDYWEILEVSISCATEGATISYLFEENDGVVTSEWQEYTGPFYIGASGTLYAIATKDGVDSEQVSAYFNRVPPIDPSEFEGEGSVDNPYTVADLQKMNEVHYPEGEVWVKGVIVGAISGTKIVDTEIESNIALAATADETDFSNVIPVELKKDTEFRENLNIVDNPGNIGKEVMVYGTIMKYFGVTGVKNLSDYSIEGVVTIATPVFSPNGGEFENSIEVTLTCATEGATIYYTEESDKLEFEWIAYNGPITLTKTTMLWVKAVKDNVETEPVYATFTKKAGQQEPVGDFVSNFYDKNLSVGPGELDWDASIDANGFDSTYDRGVQFGAGKGEFELTSTEVLTDVTSVSMIVSTNATGNTIAVKVGETYFALESATKDYPNPGDLEQPEEVLGRMKAPEANTYTLNKENNMTLVFTGEKSSGKVTIEVNDASKSVYFKQITIEVEKEVPTAIQTVKTVSTAAAYNLQGQRVEKAVRGLYIINGKKVLVK